MKRPRASLSEVRRIGKEKDKNVIAREYSKTSYPVAEQRWVSSGMDAGEPLTGGLPSPPAVSGNDDIFKKEFLRIT